MTPRTLVLGIHLYVGLVVGLLLVSAGLTGSILVWRHEIDALLHPELLRVEPAGTRIPLQQVVERVEAAYPGSSVLRIRLPKIPEAAHEVVTVGADPLQVYVDPYRGTVLGARGEAETAMNALFHWHTSLLSGETGKMVTGTAALLLLVLVISGLVVWWPGLRRLRDALVVKWRANWKRVNFDVHRAGGFWGAAFLTVMAVTGSSLIFHEAYMAGLNWATRSPPRPTAPAVMPLAGRAPLPLDVLVERAARAIPRGEVTVLTLPQTPAGPVVVRRKVPEELHPNGRNFVYLNPQTGEVLAVENALTAPAGTRAYNILYPIHIGRWGGALSRVLYSIFGLVPLILFVSGVLIWRNRTRGKRRRKTAPRRGIRRRQPQESGENRVPAAWQASTGAPAPSPFATE